jgi:hypothetical protein
VRTRAASEPAPSGPNPLEAYAAAPAGCAGSPPLDEQSFQEHGRAQKGDYLGDIGLEKRGDGRMLKSLLSTAVITLGLVGPAMAQERILISSDWGEVMADLVANDATKSLVRMLPLTIEMSDHLRQEKTGNLPSPLPAVKRQLDFAAGTIGLWSSDHFVIYYRDGRVPQPGIVLLGRVTGDASIFDTPGPVTIRIEHID